jgi:cytidylate kinase
MFRIIAMEREYGAGGSLVAAELAKRKGWQLLDKQLTCAIAKLASVEDKVVARHEERCDPLMHRLAKVFWRGSYERAIPIADDKIFDADMMVHYAEQAIGKLAQEGNCVIVGRAAPWFLRDRKDTFRVFVYGSREEKIRRMVRLKMNEKEAIEMVDTIDLERAAFVKKYFNGDWPTRRLYHLMINSDPGLDYVTETVLATMDALEAKQQDSTKPPLQRSEPVPRHAM